MSDQYDRYTDESSEMEMQVQVGVQRKRYYIIRRTVVTTGLSLAGIAAFIIIFGWPATQGPVASVSNQQSAEIVEAVQNEPFVQPVSAEPFNTDLGNNLSSLPGAQVDWALVSIQELQAKIVEVPSVLGNLPMGEAQSEIDLHHDNFLSLALSNNTGLSGEAKLTAMRGEAEWLMNAVALDGSSYADAAIKDIILSLDLGARGGSGLNSGAIPWIANAIAGIKQFEGYVYQAYPLAGTDMSAVAIADDLFSDATAAFQQEAAEIRAQEEQLAREAAEAAIAAQQPSTDPNAATNPVPEEAPAVEPASAPAAQPLQVVQTNPAMQPTNMVETLQSEGVTGNEMTPVLANAPMGNLGFGFSEIPIIWTIRNFWDVAMGNTTWDQLPGTRTWYVWDEWIVEEFNILGVPVTWRTIFLSEVPPEQMDVGGLHPGIVALRGDTTCEGTDLQGHHWICLSTIWQERENNPGETIQFNNVADLIVDIAK